MPAQETGWTAEMARALVEAHGLGWAMLSPADIEFSPRRLLQPDLFVVPAAERRPTSWRDVNALLLAVEVVSPGTARADRLPKRAIYLQQRVPEYWIIGPDARVVERWRPDDERPEPLQTPRWRSGETRANAG